MNFEWPFVSRKKYDELSERLAKLEAAMVPEKSADPTLAPYIPRSPFTGRVTLESLAMAARADAVRRKNTPGSKPISIELQEAALMGRRDAIGN